MKLSSFVGLFGLALTLGLVASSCDKKKSDSSDDKTTGTDTDPTKAGTVNVTTSALAEAIYPSGLNVTAFPTEKLDATKVGQVGVSVESGAAALKLLLDEPPNPPQGGDQQCHQKYQVDSTGRLFSVADETIQAVGNVDPLDPCGNATPAPQPVEDTNQNGQQKLQSEQDVLAGTATECLTSRALRLVSQPAPEGNEGCYQFDYGIMQGASCVEPQEVCMVRTSRNLVDSGSSQIEGGLGIMQAMLCQAKKDGKADALPAIGETLDLATNLQTAVAGRDDAPTITVAKIQRLADVDGKAVYKSSLTFSTKQGMAVEFNLAHSPTSAASAYSGVMWIKRSGGPGQGQQGADGISALSVQYSREGEGTAARLKMDVLSASLASTFTPFTAEGLVSLPAEKTLDNSKLSGITRYSFNINPETSEGQLALWKNPGGNYDERARGFIFDVAYDSVSNGLKGCGVAGADQSSIRAGIDKSTALTPTAVYTPSICRADGQAGPNDNVSAKVWKQCFSQNDAGIYVVDPAKTTDASGFDYIPATEGGLTPPSISFSSLGSVNQ